MATSPNAGSNDIEQKLQFLAKQLGSAKAPGARDLMALMKKEFGSALTFHNFHIVRDAFGTPEFESVARRILSLKGMAAMSPRTKSKGQSAKKATKKATKKAAKKTAKKSAKKTATKSASAAPKMVSASSSEATNEKKTRGERRDKVVRRGRRKDDRHLVTLIDAPKHLVLVDHEGEVTDFRFANKADAKDCIQQQLLRGISPRKILYYERSEYSVNINL